MEQVFFRVHIRTVTQLCQIMPTELSRKKFQRTLGVISISLFCLLVYFHFLFVSNNPYVATTPSYSKHATATCDNQLETNCFINELKLSQLLVPTINSLSDVIQITIASDHNLIESRDEIYFLSNHHGYLLLLEKWKQHNITLLKINLSQASSCFGPLIVNSIVHHALGYDTIVLALFTHLKRFMSSPREIIIEEPSGYVLNQNSRQLFTIPSARTLHPIALKIVLVLTICFLLFTSSTLISLLLRETQERMLKFSFLLQYYVRHELPYFKLVLTHIVESLIFVPIMIGMLFFLSECLSDVLLAFLVF